ncbi:MAG: ABC transporter permease subunit [Clostridiaceae bacterium]|jgi:polar amino acid transport system substrate-binding protein|nr:ABC transporter permease subunit [Clostridiaceae bacterium]
MKRIAAYLLLSLALLAFLFALFPAFREGPPVMAEGAGIVEEDLEKSPQPEYASTRDMNEAKAKMGVRTGSIQDAYTAQYLPDTSILYFEGISDMILALTSNKIDGFMTVATRVPIILRENTKLAAIELEGPQDHVAFMSARTEFSRTLLERLNAYILSIEENGLFNELYDQWFKAEDNYPSVITPSDLPADNGIIRYVAQGNMEPISFMEGGILTGLELDLLSRFCRDYGYGLTVTESNIAGMLAGITTGKYDLAGGGLAITEERRQSVDFTESYYAYGQWIITRALDHGKGIPGQVSGTSIWVKISNSFHKTFIKESRWKLIASGMGVTLFISITSGLMGSLLGFGICLLRMSKKRGLAIFAKGFIGLIQGVPLVVLLMIFYYVLFGSVDVNAIIVAVIGISIHFAVYVGEMMRTGIEAVPRGQVEASLALGYNPVQTFRKVIFPQATRHILPVYKGEFISMVKMTSVVSFIAVQDLTKASDIIRSRTYEAFFPLIVTAVIYFLLAWVLTSLLSLVEIRIDPRKRSRHVKGVTEA